jgi:tryptophan-rich sensory protein
MAEPARRNEWWKTAIVTVVAIELLGGLSGWLSQSGYGNPWFDTLQKPSFMPPGFLFGIVWPILYALLGLALAMIVAEPPSDRRRLALILFGVQMVLNFAWSPLFFAGHDITLAKYVIIAMIVIAAAAALLFYRLRPVAGLLMVPYLCWLMFATALNTSIEALNPGGGVALFQP